MLAFLDKEHRRDSVKRTEEYKLHNLKRRIAVFQRIMEKEKGRQLFRSILQTFISPNTQDAYESSSLSLYQDTAMA